MRYGRHLRMALTIASISFSYVDKVKAEGLRASLKYAIGWPYCDKIALMPTPQASHSITKD